MMKTILALVCLLLGLNVSAKKVKTSALQLYPDSALVKNDLAVRVGKLPNGLTYYIRHNEWPKDRACFYLAQRVGSLQEEDNQRGLAHFLEHMCFNGSEHFPGNSIRKFCEGMGLAAGAELNAYTSKEETVYNIDDVPTNIGEGKLDSCLLILYDWAGALTLDSAEIENERGIIHEEWRQSEDASDRIYKTELPKIFLGTKYGERQPIGLMSVVDSFPRKALVDYYHKWYTPQNQCVLVVGDINVDSIETKIKALFSKREQPIDAGVVEEVLVPDHKGIIVNVAKDKELGGNSIGIYFKHNPRTRDEKKYVGSYRKDNYGHMARFMLDVRLSDKALEASSPFTSASVDEDEFFGASTKRDYEITVSMKDGKQCEALTAAVEEVKRAVVYGFTEEELVRAKANAISSFDDYLNGADKVTSASKISEYYNNYLHGTPYQADSDYVAMYKEFVNETTLDDVNNAIKKCLPDSEDNMVIISWNVDKGDTVSYPTEQELIDAFHKGKAAKVAPYIDRLHNASITGKLPKAGKIIREEKSDKFGYTKLYLSNGAKVLLKHSDLERGTVYLRAWKDGGWSVYGAEEQPTLRNFNSLPFGYNGLSQSDINKLYAGKNVMMTRYLGMREFTLDGNCATVDLETLMQFLYANITHASLDTAKWNNKVIKLAESLENSKHDPDDAFSDSAYVVSMRHHPRFKPLDLDMLGKIDSNRGLEIFRHQTADISGFTFMFAGDFDDKVMKKLICKYVASLPTNDSLKLPKVPYIDWWPKDDAECHFTREMETPKTSAELVWTSDCFARSQRNGVLFEIAGKILQMVYDKKVREDISATYGCGVDISSSNDNDKKRRLTIFTVDCNMKPEAKDSVLAVIKREFKAMAENIDGTYFNSAKENSLKWLEEAQNTSLDYWKTAIERYDRTNYDGVTGRRELTESLTKEDLQQFMKEFLNLCHFSEVVMEPK